MQYNPASYSSRKMDYIDAMEQLQHTEFGRYDGRQFSDICAKIRQYNNQTVLDVALRKACEYNTPLYAKILLDHGADPNADNGQPGFIAAEHGYLDTLKLLHSRGAILQERFFNAASYWGYNDVAYWLYMHGLRGYETIEFEIYKGKQDALRDAAARKIYFWIIPKLYRNNAFVMRQAASSYDNLFKCPS